MKKSFIFEYVKSYLVVLGVAIVLMTIVNFVYIKIMENDTIQKNNILLEHIKTSFDLRFNDISNLSFEIEKNEHNENIMRASVLNKNDVYKLINDLDIYKITNHLVENIYIYYPVHNMVVTNAGVFTLKGFYKLNHKYEEKYYQEYKNMLLDKHFREYKATRDVVLNGDTVVNLNYYHSFPSNAQRTTVGVLGVKIGIDKMAKEIDNIALGNAEYFAVADDYNTLISYSGNRILEELIDGMKFSFNDNIEVRTKNSTVISHIHSSFNNINYVSICGKNVMLKTINLLQNILLLSILFIFIVDLLIAFYFSKKNEKPILTITKTLEGTTQSKKIEGGIYKYIEDRIKLIIDENKSITGKLRKQTLLLKNVFLTRLLRGEIIDKNNFLQLATNYSIDISRETYAVMLIYIDSVPEPIMQEAFEDNERVNALLAIIKTAMLDTFNKQSAIEVFELDGVSTALLSLDFKENQDELLSKYIAMIIKKLSGDYNINVRIASGSMYKGFNQITMSYYESLQVLEKLLNDKNEKFLCYMALKNYDHKGKNENLDLLSMFINCIKLQDYNNALAITDQLFTNYLYAALPSEFNSLRRSTIVSIVLDMMEQISQLHNGEGFPYHSYRSMLASAMNQQDKLKEIIKEIISSAIEYKQKIEACDYNKYIYTLKDYIDKNYTNPDLGLFMVAEAFGINESYLSKMFKKEFNIGLLSYINKIRIEKSKALLLEKTLNIAQISRDVGYISDITFIRVFKRYEGTTPGRYRELNSQI